MSVVLWLQLKAIEDPKPISSPLLTNPAFPYIKDPKLWELWYIPYMGDAGFISSAVPGPVSRVKPYSFSSVQGLRV